MDPNDFDELLRIQRMMASKLMEERSVDAKIKVLDLIRSMITNKNKKVQIETVIYEGRMEGFSENDMLRFIDDLQNDGLISAGEDGYIRIIN